MGVLYEHWRLDINECFYVGISWAAEHKRPYDFSARNKYHKNIVQKLKPLGLIESRIQVWGEPKEILCKLEPMQISYWKQLIGRRLTNIAPGGEGVTEWSEEMIAAARKRALELWEDPEYRKERLEYLKSKEHSEIMSSVAAESWLDNFERIESARARKFSYWANPEWAATTIEAIRAVTSTEEFSENCRASAIAQWSDENKRQKLLSGIFEAWQNEERIEAASDRQSNLWSDEIWRENTIQAMKEAQKTPKARQRALSHSWWLSNVKNKPYWGC